MAIGSRAQSARTYLEKHYKSFENCRNMKELVGTVSHFIVVGKDELIQHALQALRGCLQGDQELTSANASIAIVGKDHDLLILEDEKLQPYVRV